MTKNQEVLGYLIQKHPEAGITVLMKLCYLIDLIATKKSARAILGFEYIRYKYGPFDESIYDEVNALREKGLVIESSEYTTNGKEFTYFRPAEDAIFSRQHLIDEEITIIDEVLELVKGHGAKALTEICYKTKPMKALGATLGGDENLYKKLDLSLVVEK